MPTVPVSVIVPGGFNAGGAWSRALLLRPCTGADEAWLADMGTLTPAERTTGLLERCLEGQSGVELARRLTVGDREALLLHLRRITLGDRLECVADCQHCHGRMDIDARVADLVLPAYAHDGWEHEAQVHDWRVRFRLPNGGDQEAAARAVERGAGGVAPGVAVLVERCVREVRGADGTPVGALPASAVPALAAAMAERDPQAEVVLSGDCPHCQASFARPLDAARLVHDELASDGEELFREVHVIASHYHWSEAEILSLSSRQRRRYLGFIAEGRRDA